MTHHLVMTIPALPIAIINQIPLDITPIQDISGLVPSSSEPTFPSTLPNCLFPLHLYPFLHAAPCLAGGQADLELHSSGACQAVAQRLLSVLQLCGYKPQPLQPSNITGYEVAATPGNGVIPTAIPTAKLGHPRLIPAALTTLHSETPAAQCSPSPSVFLFLLLLRYAHAGSS